MMTREKIDILVHIPLEAEYMEFRELFAIKEELQDDLNVIAWVNAPSHFKVAVIVQEKMGRSSAAHACQKALQRFEPKLYICLGIAGGLSKDLKLGDVCYTGSLIDVYDNSKVTDVAGGGVDIALSPEFYASDRRMTAAVGFVRTLQSLSDLHNFWKEDQQQFAEETVPGKVIGREDKLERIGAPKCLNGDLVCGAVSESDKYRERLRGVTRNILAIETESGPVFQMCGEAGIQALTIRGISDYANASKGKLEGDSKEAVRRVAARNAASFLHMQLQSDVFIEAFRKVCGVDQAEPQLDLPSQKKSGIPEWLTSVGDEVDAKLRELSPQFRTKPLGFKLPAPRVKRELGAAARDPKKRPAAIEFVTAVARHRRMAIYVPRTYPDQALSWVLASSLLQADVAGKKVIPIVIDGRKLGPPRDGFGHLAPIELADNIEDMGGEYVFIIDEPPITSKPKVTFLSEELKKWGNTRAVFLTRKDRAFVESAEFTRQLSADEFSLCDVSFSEMAAFIESSFELPGHEAEVVALKLRGMFQRFALPAHPSFFAGIPSEALAALLLANRRSELIQLAVDGFLSFVVASDTEQPRMSRSNRAKFLRQLVIRSVHEKRQMDEAGLVQFAREVSEEFDYGLNPIAFVQAFVNAGIIHFEDGRASITLPFISSYLFADELSKDPGLADDYFRSVGDDPDLSVFDLYAEIGPSPDIVRRVIENLDASIASLPIRNDPHILLSGTINPVILKNPARLTNLSEKVSDARTAIAEGTSHRSEKARILDIADRVNEDVAERSHPDQTEPADETEDQQRVIGALKNWTVATILLGSGAENIKGVERQALVMSIIRGGESLLDAMLRHISNIDFDSIKKAIISDENFRHDIGVSNDDEFEGVVSALVDLVEYLALSEPLDRVFDQLPDVARHRIVGNSIGKVEPDSPLQALIRDNWLTNISPSDGKGALLRSVHDIPKVHFLRASLTSIYIMRAKWRVPELETRMALLDAAEEAVRPFNPHLDKGEMIRFVEKHVPGTTSSDDEEQP